MKAWRLLGLESHNLDRIIAEVEAGLAATYGGPLPISANLCGKSVCFTGALNCRLQGQPIERKAAQALVAENVMVIKNSVSQKLDYLVAADPHSLSGKAKKAREYGVKIVAEREFWRMLGVSAE